MIYVDTSGIVKLAREEKESEALRTWLLTQPQPLVTSALARTETLRAIARARPSVLPTASAVLAVFHQIPVSDAVMDAAAALPGRALRSLDAIHLATAESIRAVITWFVAYDVRLTDAASARGLPVVSPC